MIKESITSIQALLLCGITFCWGLMAGNKKARPYANVAMIICSTILMAINF